HIFPSPRESLACARSNGLFCPPLGHPCPSPHASGPPLTPTDWQRQRYCPAGRRLRGNYQVSGAADCNNLDSENNRCLAGRLRIDRSKHPGGRPNQDCRINRYVRCGQPMRPRLYPVLTGRHSRNGFTLAEILVSMAVLTLLLLFVSQLVSHATALNRTGNKHIDTDTQARVVLDRIAIDIGQMLKRTDVDYYIKQPIKYNGHGNGHGFGKKLQTGQQGSDQIAFFSQVSGYYPSTGSQSPLSLVAYRINEDSTSASYLKLERM